MINNRIALFGATLLVAVVGLITWRSFQAEAIEITITDTAFTPQTVTIGSGTVVVFRNQDRLPHWPASDFHPEHSLYPGFDPRVSLAPGKQWQFRFNRSGTWTYHDHENPHIKGTIIVKPPTKLQRAGQIFSQIVRPPRLKLEPTPKASLVPAAAFRQLDQKEQLSQLAVAAKTQSATFVWQFVLDTFRNQGGLTQNAHDLAHFAGGLLYQQYQFAGLRSCTPEFAFGCYHGLLDYAFHTSLDSLPQAQASCQFAGNQGSGPYNSCIHGIGHGVASFYKTEDLNQALATCQRIKPDEQYCYDGVLMEFARNAPQSFYRPNDLLYPCSTLDEIYQAACGRNQPTVLLNRLGQSFDQVIATCLGAQNETFKGACIDAVGFIATARSGGQAQAIITDCAKIADLAYHSQCLQKAAGELIFQSSPNWQHEAPQVCQALPDTITACQDYLSQIKSDYGR